MKYDVIVVGGGSAGCTIASRLSEDPGRSVLLLEAGPDYTDFDTLPGGLKTRQQRLAVGLRPPQLGVHRPNDAGTDRVDYPQREGHRGSSAVDGQVLFRGIPEDYDRWAEWGNDEWGFIKVLPYFNKLETDLDFGGSDFHGSEGPVPVRRSPAASGCPTPWPSSRPASPRAIHRRGPKPPRVHRHFAASAEHHRRRPDEHGPYLLGPGPPPLEPDSQGKCHSPAGPF